MITANKGHSLTNTDVNIKSQSGKYQIKGKVFFDERDKIFKRIIQNGPVGTIDYSEIENNPAGIVEDIVRAGHQHAISTSNITMAN